MIDVVILDVAVGAAGVEHLALRVHRHGHNGAVVVPQGLQKSDGAKRLSTFLLLLTLTQREERG